MKVLKSIIYSIVVCFLFLSPTFSQINVDSLLKELDVVLKDRPEHMARKRANILEQQTKFAEASDLETRYSALLRLCEEYQSFNFDTAYIYTSKLVKLAKKSDDPEFFAKARVRQAFSLLSAGLFREAIDSLANVDLTQLSRPVIADYYATKARCYLDISRFYNDDKFGPWYFNKGIGYLDTAIIYFDDPLERLSSQGNRAIMLGNLSEALRYYQELVASLELPSRQLAKESAGLGLVYRAMGEVDTALPHLILGAIADEINCVKENTALMLVAQILYQKGDYERSDRYIDIALSDANFYNARLRKFQILGVLPLIKARQEILSEQKLFQLRIFILILAAFLLLSLGLIYNNILKNRALRQKEKKLTQAYQELEDYTKALYEADKIKENYIGHFFQRNTRFIKYADLLFRNSRKALGEQKLSDAQYYLKQFNGRREQQKLLQEFDKVFLTIFPTFVEQFNALFAQEYQFKVEEGKLSYPELRIFALLRLGVKDNETIARALDYSINTIYTYKTKTRNHSLLKNEDFDRAVMNIMGLQSENS